LGHTLQFVWFPTPVHQFHSSPHTTPTTTHALPFSVLLFCTHTRLPHLGLLWDLPHTHWLCTHIALTHAVRTHFTYHVATQLLDSLAHTFGFFGFSHTTVPRFIFFHTWFSSHTFYTLVAFPFHHTFLRSSHTPHTFIASPPDVWTPPRCSVTFGSTGCHTHGHTASAAPCPAVGINFLSPSSHCRFDPSLVHGSPHGSLAWTGTLVYIHLFPHHHDGLPWFFPSRLGSSLPHCTHWFLHEPPSFATFTVSRRLVSTRSHHTHTFISLQFFLLFVCRTFTAHFAFVHLSVLRAMRSRSSVTPLRFFPHYAVHTRFTVYTFFAVLLCTPGLGLPVLRFTLHLLPGPSPRTATVFCTHTAYTATYHTVATFIWFFCLLYRTRFGLHALRLRAGRIRFATPVYRRVWFCLHGCHAHTPHTPFHIAGLSVWFTRLRTRYVRYATLLHFHTTLLFPTFLLVATWVQFGPLLLFCFSLNRFTRLNLTRFARSSAYAHTAVRAFHTTFSHHAHILPHHAHLSSATVWTFTHWFFTTRHRLPLRGYAIRMPRFNLHTTHFTHGSVCRNCATSYGYPRSCHTSHTLLLVTHVDLPPRLRHCVLHCPRLDTHVYTVLVGSILFGLPVRPTPGDHHTGFVSFFCSYQTHRTRLPTHTRYGSAHLAPSHCHGITHGWTWFPWFGCHTRIPTVCTSLDACLAHHHRLHTRSHHTGLRHTRMPLTDSPHWTSRTPRTFHCRFTRSRAGCGFTSSQLRFYIACIPLVSRGWFYRTPHAHQFYTTPVSRFGSPCGRHHRTCTTPHGRCSYRARCVTCHTVTWFPTTVLFYLCRLLVPTFTIPLFHFHTGCRFHAHSSFHSFTPAPGLHGFLAFHLPPRSLPTSTPAPLAVSAFVHGFLPGSNATLGSVVHFTHVYLHTFPTAVFARFHHGLHAARFAFGFTNYHCAPLSHLRIYPTRTGLRFQPTPLRFRAHVRSHLAMGLRTFLSTLGRFHRLDALPYLCTGTHFLSHGYTFLLPVYTRLVYTRCVANSPRRARITRLAPLRSFYRLQFTRTVPSSPRAQFLLAALPADHTDLRHSWTLTPLRHWTHVCHLSVSLHCIHTFYCRTVHTVHGFTPMPCRSTHGYRLDNAFCLGLDAAHHAHCTAMVLTLHTTTHTHHIHLFLSRHATARTCHTCTARTHCVPAHTHGSLPIGSRRSPLTHASFTPHQHALILPHFATALRLRTRSPLVYHACLICTRWFVLLPHTRSFVHARHVCTRARTPPHIRYACSSVPPRRFVYTTRYGTVYAATTFTTPLRLPPLVWLHGSTVPRGYASSRLHYTLLHISLPRLSCRLHHSLHATLPVLSLAFTGGLLFLHTFAHCHGSHVALPFATFDFTTHLFTPHTPFHIATGSFGLRSLHSHVLHTCRTRLGPFGSRTPLSLWLHGLHTLDTTTHTLYGRGHWTVGCTPAHTRPPHWFTQFSVLVRLRVPFTHVSMHWFTGSTFTFTHTRTTHRCLTHTPVRTFVHTVTPRSHHTQRGSLLTFAHAHCYISLYRLFTLTPHAHVCVAFRTVYTAHGLVHTHARFTSRFWISPTFTWFLLWLHWFTHPGLDILRFMLRLRSRLAFHAARTVFSLHTPASPSLWTHGLRYGLTFGFALYMVLYHLFLHLSRTRCRVYPKFLVHASCRFLT